MDDTSTPVTLTVTVELAQQLHRLLLNEAFECDTNQCQDLVPDLLGSARSIKEQLAAQDVTVEPIDWTWSTGDVL